MSRLVSSVERRRSWYSMAIFRDEDPLKPRILTGFPFNLGEGRVYGDSPLSLSLATRLMALRLTRRRLLMWLSYRLHCQDVALDSRCHEVEGTVKDGFTVCVCVCLFHADGLANDDFLPASPEKKSTRKPAQQSYELISQVASLPPGKSRSCEWISTNGLCKMNTCARSHPRMFA